MTILDFRNFGFLTPKNQYLIVSEINDQKIYNFLDIWKTGIFVIELSVTNSCTKFQANIFIFGCEMAQKPIDGNDVIFWNSIFGISDCRTTKQMTFLESWDKT